MRGEADVQPQYPIGTVAQRTGLSTHVLRAWEKRYGLVEPRRDAGGARLYSNADVVRLRLLRRVTEGGHPIGRVAALGTEQLLALLREHEQDPHQPTGGRGAGEAARFVSLGLEAVEAMDAVRVQSVLGRAMLALALPDFVEGVVVPLLHGVGDLWAAGSVCPAHEHLLSVCVQRVLARAVEGLHIPSAAPVLVATTLSEQRHELGALLVGVVAADLGWRPVYLGPDLPASDVARAVSATGAAAVALSVVLETAADTLRAQLSELRAGIPGGVLVFVGGRAAAEHRDLLAETGATWLPDFDALRIALQAAHPDGEGKG